MKRIRAQEQETLVAALYHLREIDRRRLYCDYKFKTMKDFATQELKYSEDEADRRLSAMYVLDELPEIASQINDGTLTLTNLCLARVVFNKERKSGREMTIGAKREFVAKLENKSSRDAQRIAAEFCPEMTPRDLSLYQIQDLVLRAQAEELMRHYDLSSLSGLLRKLFTQELDAIAKNSAAPRKCINCGSTFKVEEDHIWPKAAGGSDEPENLRLLCRTCNQRAAIKFYGMLKMSKHLDSTSQEPSPYKPDAPGSYPDSS